MFLCLVCSALHIDVLHYFVANIVTICDRNKFVVLFSKQVYIIIQNRLKIYYLHLIFKCEYIILKLSLNDYICREYTGCVPTANYKLNTIKKMEELVNKIKTEFEALAIDANLQIEKGNKAAGTRARKSSLDLEKLLKEFRKVSLEASKK